MLFNILNRHKRPPDRNWRFQKQTEPPTFGYARRVNMKLLENEVNKRRDKCIEIQNNASQYCNFVEGKISLIVLSCMRWPTLKRLIGSMKDYFGRIESYPHIEKILVDNGSGPNLINAATETDFFDKIIFHPGNLGIVGALKDAFKKVDGEYILVVEDDFVLDYDKPFIGDAISVFKEFPEVGIIRLKNQNNWWKPQRVIAPVRKTAGGAEFWTWLPSRGGMLNGWCAGSVMFKKVSYFSVGELPDVEENLSRERRWFHQGYIYECVYGKDYNKQWLAAKIKGCYPFFQPNVNKESIGWGK